MNWVGPAALTQALPGCFSLYSQLLRSGEKKTPNPSPLAEVVFSHQNECKCCKNTSQELLPAKFHTPACHIPLFHIQTAAAASLPSFLLIFFPQDSGEESGRNVLPKLSLSRPLSTEQAGNHFPKIKKTSGSSFPGQS